jgi:hypothetical protein
MIPCRDPLIESTVGGEPQRRLGSADELAPAVFRAEIECGRGARCERFLHQLG